MSDVFDQQDESPVILDPNTANPRLALSDDLTSVIESGNKQLLPDNPERFDWYRCVLGSEGFNSGTHCWDVEVKDSLNWELGVTTASNQRKGFGFFDTDVWCVQYGFYQPPGFSVEQELERVRVYLDYDRGTVSFTDPYGSDWAAADHMTDISTYRHTHTDILLLYNTSINNE
ncbi:Nuclear factor 7, ovary [Labeo rohita]|uniref:Nuclear factor 7, ovary n=1 Tax=Labeo rohita TaxID=84645 RepID=A0ABQ8MWV5_LABRO|nr:Nuclear factor 7, ovary [Labeo rohita]